MTSNSSWRKEISSFCPNQDWAGSRTKELPKEMRTSATPMTRMTRPKKRGIKRSERGVGRVRSDSWISVFRRDVVGCFWRDVARGILEVFEPRDTGTFCQVVPTRWGHRNVTIGADCAPPLSSEVRFGCDDGDLTSIRPAERGPIGRGRRQSRPVVLRCGVTGCTWRPDRYVPGRPS